MEKLIANFNYVIVVILMMIGLWSMLAQKNLIKKCIGMAIFQTGIILFFISIGAKDNALIPILTEAANHTYPVSDVSKVANPLTQILMLTAIVVGVATLGVALALAQKIYQQHSSFDEDEILENERK
ncbi:MAG: cation:proton antiporter subunit C [Verrucomicrobiota bacterium]|jgi:multicomponent Na+:H+ antiporter subunit C|nr:cation:proton antiporter subunit C [Verrucomicrobiota bacterium]MDP6252897.1 cation:proton antiporter subunit C [Verrucomicrobiota bacterium]MDP6915235.1 cation:proton antiporter subunit C [Verrucomicrobiota bacterium]MDP7177741.1 cation:proton antiporter subunit C [Verrucomicrobiota bacterium]MDP7442538.1 cation:proton antiporter subunit C [Verrucomicrobiota bacterium]